jgi:hypothetical protein
LLARRKSPLLSMAGTVEEADRMAAVVVPTVVAEAAEDFTSTQRLAVVAEDSAAA